MNNLTKIYIPIRVRPPNKFVNYCEVDFVCGQYRGIKKIAVFLDKSGNTREEVAQVIWEEKY